MMETKTQLHILWLSNKETNLHLKVPVVKLFSLFCALVLCFCCVAKRCDLLKLSQYSVTYKASVLIAVSCDCRVEKVGLLQNLVGYLVLQTKLGIPFSFWKSSCSTETS